jgi:hypothetical protein
MKRIMLPFLAILLVSACQMKSGNENASNAVFDPSAVQLPMKLSYTGKWTLGDPQNALTVMNFDNKLMNGDMDLGSMLADTVAAHFSDGSVVEVTKDSVIAMIKAWRNSMSKVEINYTTIIPVKNIDQNQDWVLTWMEEKDTNMKDSVDSFNLHEDYYMVNGKIRTVYQYRQNIKSTGM